MAMDQAPTGSSVQQNHRYTIVDTRGLLVPVAAHLTGKLGADRSDTAGLRRKCGER
jgi:hypothetical protein